MPGPQERTYLTLAEVLGMHHALIEKYGGSHGLRDPGALESALFRPQSGYYADVIAEAAALMESLINNHPFTDGIKRIAFAATDVFLRLNGHRIQGKSAKIHREMMKMFQMGAFDIAHIEAWLRESVVISWGVFRMSD